MPKKGQSMNAEHRQKIGASHRKRLLDPVNMAKAKAGRAHMVSFKKPPRFTHEHHTERARRLKYGLHPHEFKAMWEAQDSKCAICYREISLGVGNHAIDHCHRTNRVRAILCLNCNVCLGWFERFRDIAIEYLRRHGS